MKVTSYFAKSKWVRHLGVGPRKGWALWGLALAACGPIAHVPPLPVHAVGALAEDDSLALLARRLAPALFVQRDEPFRLLRVVAVIDSSRRAIAYHLLWEDDVTGAWLPFTSPTDEELVWVGYDSTGSATDLWTYWHHSILHTDWRGKGQPAIDVQWGKHGSLPHGTRLEMLPWLQTMPAFYLFTWLGIPDAWLGTLVRPGPVCFCHSYARYLDFARPLATASRLDLILLADPHRHGLEVVFGRGYSRKRQWPW